jgi:hypothetical protein
VRLDTQWPQNPKFLMLAEDKKWRAITVYMGGLAYSGAHGTKGFLPALCLSLCHGTKREAAELVEVGLWIPQPGGWDINGWSEFQPETDDAEARRDKAKKAAAARWRRKEGSVIDMHERHA